MTVSINLVGGGTIHVRYLGRGEVEIYRGTETGTESYVVLLADVDSAIAAMKALKAYDDSLRGRY